MKLEHFQKLLMENNCISRELTQGADLALKSKPDRVCEGSVCGSWPFMLMSGEGDAVRKLSLHRLLCCSAAKANGEGSIRRPAASMDMRSKERFWA